MPQFPVAIHHPDHFDPSTGDEAVMHDIHAFNREAIAAGVRVFACGLQPAGMAKSLRSQPDGGVLITDGPYLEAKEHVGGFWILECADMDQALAWGVRGDLLMKMGRFAEAREEVQRALTMTENLREQELLTERLKQIEQAALSA